MKKVLFFLIIGSLSFSGCKFINEKILKKGSDTLEVYIYNLEQKVANQDAELQSSLAQLQRQSQKRSDNDTEWVIRAHSCSSEKAEN